MLKTHHLPISATLSDYQSQADQLLQSWMQGEETAYKIFHQTLPRLHDEKVKWLPKPLSEKDLRDETFDENDSRMAVARGYDFLDWNALESFASMMECRDPVQFPFESAIDAVIEGKMDVLKNLLEENPKLVYVRSERVTHFDPSVHRATLLHYVAANGTENYRQRSPANSVEIARVLLEAGAEVDSLANLYAGECTTMSLLVSSSHPAEAKVQVPLIDLLVFFGASLHNTGIGNWVSPIETAMVFGFKDAAETLLKHGAPLSLAGAAALGMVDEFKRLLTPATGLQRHRAFALATQSGQLETTMLLLKAGEDPNRFNPEGTHAHSTPLHQAVWNGHTDMVKLLLQHGARIDMKDTIYQSTPLGWAEHGEKHELTELLRTFDASSRRKHG